jgi:hypothetical protein
MMNKVNITRCVIVLLLLTVFVNASAAWAQLGPPKYQLTTSCVTEIRGGKKSYCSRQSITKLANASDIIPTRRSRLKSYAAPLGLFRIVGSYPQLALWATDISLASPTGAGRRSGTHYYQAICSVHAGTISRLLSLQHKRH